MWGCLQAGWGGAIEGIGFREILSGVLAGLGRYESIFTWAYVVKPAIPLLLAQDAKENVMSYFVIKDMVELGKGAEMKDDDH